MAISKLYVSKGIHNRVGCYIEVRLSKFDFKRTQIQYLLLKSKTSRKPLHTNRLMHPNKKFKRAVFLWSIKHKRKKKNSQMRFYKNRDVVWVESTNLKFGSLTFRSHTSDSAVKWSVMGCKTGPTIYRPCPRRIERLTTSRCHYKSITFSLVI